MSVAESLSNAGMVFVCADSPAASGGRAQMESRTVVPMKQLASVLTAIESGATTSGEAAELTGLSVKRCSSHLSYLLGLGVVQKTGLIRKPVHQGHVSYCYEPRRA